MSIKRYSVKEDGLYTDTVTSTYTQSATRDWEEEEYWSIAYGREKKLIDSHPNMEAGKKFDSASPVHASTIGIKIFDEIEKSQDKFTQMIEPSDADVVKQAMQNWAGQFDQATQEEIQKSEIYQDTQKEPDPYTPFPDYTVLNKMKLDEEVQGKLKQIVSWQLAGSLGFDQYLLWKEADDEDMSTELTDIVDNRAQAYFDSYADGTWDYEKVLDIHNNTFETWKIYRHDYFRDQGGQQEEQQQGRDKQDILDDYTGEGWNPFNVQSKPIDKPAFLDELINWYQTTEHTKGYSQQELFDAVKNDLNVINHHEGLKAYNIWVLDGDDGDDLYFKVFGIRKGAEGDSPADFKTLRFTGSYQQAGWSDIYETFMRNKVGLSNPSLWEHSMSQGIGGDPLQRIIYSQYNLQATEDDPWRGDLTGSLVKDDGAGGTITPGKMYGKDNYEISGENPYDKFLQGYRPLQGDNLINTIGEVINVINQEDWQTYKPERQSGEDNKYTDIELRDFRWRDRYMDDSSHAEQHQESLAALPIMQATPLALRGETSNILNNLHTAWKTDPNRDTSEGWLQYVHRNNYFGMIPKDIGSQPSKSNYMERLQKAEEEADRDKYFQQEKKLKDSSQAPSYEFEPWAY